MQALTAAGQVVGRETIDCDSRTRKSTRGQGWARRAGSWTEPHLRAGRREVVRFEDAPRNVGRGKEPVGNGKRIRREEGQKTTRLAGWEETRAVRPEDGSKPRGGKERVGKIGVWRFSARQKVEQLSSESARRRFAPSCPRVRAGNKPPPPSFLPPTYSCSRT